MAPINITFMSCHKACNILDKTGDGENKGTNIQKPNRGIWALIMNAVAE